MLTYSLRVERQFLRDWVLGVAYVGNKGTYIGASRQENPAVYIPGNSTVGNTQQRRVYPNYGSISRGESGNNSSYHSFQLNVEKRFSHGFSVLSNYVWSKNLQVTYGPDPFNNTRETSLSGDDIPHNLKFSNIWEIPRAPVTGVADKFLNGWQLNAIVVWQSGFPFGVSSGRDNGFSGGTDRADYVGGGSAQLSYGPPAQRNDSEVLRHVQVPGQSDRHVRQHRRQHSARPEILQHGLRIVESTRVAQGSRRCSSGPRHSTCSTA